ncbi:unnamed protein product [Ilex paraguariensis]|uniref:Uncharacterized protein n=1 Tax=Ilex paraguariensis TaxID=185542 RepID=A0ABC8RFR7_9AQUA
MELSPSSQSVFLVEHDYKAGGNNHMSQDDDSGVRCSKEPPDKGYYSDTEVSSSTDGFQIDLYSATFANHKAKQALQEQVPPQSVVDFNAITVSAERKGGSTPSLSIMAEFNDFINSLGVARLWFLRFLEVEDEIARCRVSHFYDLYISEIHQLEDELFSVIPNLVTNKDNNMLISPISLEELKGKGPLILKAIGVPNVFPLIFDLLGNGGWELEGRNYLETGGAI